ncbi:MAG: V-type ATPase subunit, partial [Clostridia bacterium]|nr:V-type ATPase subunit [Clostridia bacterium]
MRENYAYQVARVRVRELGLMNNQDIEQLMPCRSHEECMRTLRDKGWGTGNEKTAEEVLSAESAKTWDFIHELLDDLSDFDVLLYP